MVLPLLLQKLCDRSIKRQKSILKKYLLYPSIVFISSQNCNYIQCIQTLYEVVSNKARADLFIIMFKKVCNNGSYAYVSGVFGFC